MRIALAQINPTVGNLAGNTALIIDNIQRAQELGVDIIAFPELALCGYPPEDLLYKEQFIKSQRFYLKEIAKKTKGITVVLGFADKDKNGLLYNAAAVIADKKIKDVICKSELPNYGVFDEKRYFTPGKNNKLFTLNKVKYGINICEDIWVEAGIWKQQAKKGAKVLINLSSSPFDDHKINEREKLLKKRAKQTQSFICYVNLVGGQDELIFDGGSIVVDPQGKVLAFGKQFEEDLVITDISGGAGLPGPYTKAKAQLVFHRPKKLKPIDLIYKGLVMGTRDYIQKNGFKKVVLGLSGGIDSSLVAAIAVDAIGPDNVVGITMPSQYTSQGTKGDAHQLAQNLGMEVQEIAIKNIYDAYIETLAPALEGTKPDLTEENIQARIRGNIIMALSNKYGWLVLTTGNKSEFAVGYCTLYGDMSGGFAVLKDVPKTKVYDLSRFRNTLGAIVIPESVIDRAPSAELRPDQKDQDSLPPYDILDQYIDDYVVCHKSLAQMVKKHDPDQVKDVIRKIDLSEYKRRQSPPGIKITSRAFGKDWRLPITNNFKVK